MKKPLLLFFLLPLLPLLAQTPTPGSKQVTEQQFLQALQKCVRCHKVAANVDTLLQQHWIVPGDPEHSPVYRVLGKAKKKDINGGHYHDVTPEEKKIIHDFVAQYNSAATSGTAASH